MPEFPLYVRARKAAEAKADAVLLREVKENGEQWAKDLLAEVEVLPRGPLRTPLRNRLKYLLWHARRNP